MQNEILIPQADSRHDSLLIGSARVPARTLTATRGTTIPFDSIASPNGLPASVLGGREIPREKKKFFGRARKQTKRMNFVKNHPLCIIWWTSLLTIGAVLQFTIK